MERRVGPQRPVIPPMTLAMEHFGRGRANKARDTDTKQKQLAYDGRGDEEEYG